MSNRKEFFNRMYAHCEGRIELRAIGAKGVRAQFFEIVDHQGIDRFCNQYHNWNVFFGVGTRNDKGRGNKKNVRDMPSLFTDIDFKDIKPVEVKKRLETFPFKPTAKILSGHGVHFYWFLDEPAGRDDFELVEDLLRRICDHFNGDPSACEVARVLRVPGSMNVKRTPKLVKIHAFETFTYDLENFEILPQSKHKAKRSKTSNSPGWLFEIMRGVPEGGNSLFAGRNVAGCKLGGYLIDRIPADNVISILRGWNLRNDPPLDDNDVIKIFQSVKRYRRAGRNEKFKDYFNR